MCGAAAHGSTAKSCCSILAYWGSASAEMLADGFYPA